MKTSYEPITKRERRELEGIVSIFAMVMRFVLFAGAMFLAVRVFQRIAKPLLASFSPTVITVAWILPALVLGICFMRWSRKGSGGRRLRDAIRSDIKNGQVAVHFIDVVDAMIFPEKEDEGPTVIVKTSREEVLLFNGQKIDRLVRRGFPWRSFEIRKSPLSKRFFSINKRGEPINAIKMKCSFIWSDYKKLVAGRPGFFAVIDLGEFERLKNENS